MNSFDKGEIFESYLIRKIFTEDRYELIHRTNSFQQNQERYALNSMKPDFQFRCKETGRKFYVEAKYRSGFNHDDKMEVISHQQHVRFLNIQQDENCTVFLAVGYQGKPHSPAHLSFIPISDLQYSDLYFSTLQKFSIPKKPFANHKLRLGNENVLVRDEAKEKWERREASREPQNNRNQRTNDSDKRRMRLALVLLALVSAGLFWWWSIGSEPTKEEVIALIDNYYEAIKTGEEAGLHEYIAPKVDQWFSQKDVPLSQIEKDILRYREKYPLRIHDIDEESLKYQKLSNGHLRATFLMDYTVRAKYATKRKNYKLKIHATWDEENRILSMWEEKLE